MPALPRQAAGLLRAPAPEGAAVSQARGAEDLEQLLDVVREEVGRARPRRRRQEIHVSIVVGADGRITAESEVSPARRRPLAEKAS